MHFSTSRRFCEASFAQTAPISNPPVPPKLLYLAWPFPYLAPFTRSHYDCFWAARGGPNVFLCQFVREDRSHVLSYWMLIIYYDQWLSKQTCTSDSHNITYMEEIYNFAVIIGRKSTSPSFGKFISYFMFFYCEIYSHYIMLNNINYIHTQ